MQWLSSRAAVPAPFVAKPTFQWDGDSGAWSSFAITAGSPGQSFRVLPSTSSSEIWLPIPEGCQGALENVTDCPALRGIDGSSMGFQTNESSTWSSIGIYQLTASQTLFGNDDNGLYGLDHVDIANKPANNETGLASQVIAGIATTDYWLGLLGLGVSSANFSTQSQNIPSFLDSMKRADAIPSLSFGYTSGALYSPNQTPGSLVLGGYDVARCTPSNITFPLGGDHNLDVVVSMQSILGQSTYDGTSSLLQTGAISLIIDSAVSDLWLPQGVCDLFVTAFGLNLDANTGLFLVNESTHGELVTMNPTVTFSISPTNDSASTTNIELPYSAFDLNASIPIYNESTRYFPIRVAANTSQYVIGRTFLQEAYLFVDWERQSFTLGQAIHQNETVNIVPVLSPSTISATSGGSALSTGVIAGIAVSGAVVLIAASVVILLCLRRKRRGQEESSQLSLLDVKPSELESSRSQLAEPMSSLVHEMPGGDPKHELVGRQILEMPGDEAQKHELENPVEANSLPKERKADNALIHELP